jgi:hypothetical protein
MRLRVQAAGVVLLGALVADGTPVAAQGRFKAIAREAVAVTPHLQIVTVLDTVQSACYLLFVIEPDPPAGRHFDAARTDVQSAVTLRDRRLAELNDAYEQGFRTLYPGTPPLSVLRFEWEGWKVQSEYERVVRENELAWLEEELERIAAAPAVTVSGPVPCGARQRPSSSTNDQR